MKRHLGTALSVLGLLAVGTAAAAVNVRMLHGAGGERAQFQLSSANGVAPMALAPNDAPQALSPGRLPGQPDSSTAIPGSAGLPSVGSVAGGRGGPEDGDRHGVDSRNRPQLTDAQMNLLRVSAMVRMDPMSVRDIARGANTDADKVAAVREAAKAVGVTLRQLAAVTNLPPMHDRGHGGPEVRRGFDSATAIQDYDD